MKLSALSFPAMLAACCVFGACTVQTGTMPRIPETGTGEQSANFSKASNRSSAASSAQSSASGSLADEHEADPSPTTTDSLEAPSAAAPAAVTGHLIISTIGYGDTGEKGPPRLTEFFDYDCEYCRQHALEERDWIDANYVAAGKLSIERIFVAMTAAGKRMDQAALCAGVQNQFPAMDTYLLTNVPQTDTPIFAFAKTLKIDQAQFKTCMQNMAVAQDSYTPADGIPVKRIPAFIAGAQRWEGILTRAELQKNLDAAVRNGR
ncbi:MAG TPA: thioredoxin domain-containing protein [Candidatus Peribacteria bacterium]|nr:thioredoxin domain-containing protein [Candidatus Peribacteria bacterium]